jgi:DNA invertase Pin-like site-specific DNA recombinase
MTYLNGGPWKLIAEYTEVETGKRADRAELQKALTACRKHKVKLVIAKLDRLSRNLVFIATLMDSNVRAWLRISSFDVACHARAP